MRNIHQIHLQLVIRCCVIFSIHLRISGQSGLCLETQGKFRHLFTVLSCNLRAFRTRPTDRKVSGKDIEQLWQFINSKSADHMSDLRYPIIVFACGKSGHTIIFRIYAHTPEFQNLKFLSILCQANLPVKYRSTVIQFDCQ